VYVYVLTYVREVPGTLQGRPRVLEPTLSATFHRAIADPLAPWWSSHCGYSVAPLPFLAVFGRRSLNPISQFVEADGLLTFHGRISFVEGPDIGDVSTDCLPDRHGRRPEHRLAATPTRATRDWLPDADSRRART
jgi:hypothetical protein